ncbi:MAG: DNA/RNA nuclease SfsA [Oscillospiraceae bacterium]|nr:DNA/RNA nuclease SfsA [Oscillospiraceae bacterium]
MQYDNIHKGFFLDRPNRFIAHILVDGAPVVCHVKNTGRCRELLIPGCTVYVQHSPGENRKTQWDLVAVEKGARLINMDAAAPNAVFGEWLRAGGLGSVPRGIKPEHRHGDSRFDFYFEQEGRPSFAEIKGVTLEEDGIVRFPDAPTERGVKHLYGLISCVAEGFDAYAVFIVQMRDVRFFEPNRTTHPAFAEALVKARDAGVQILALDCEVQPDRIQIAQPVPVCL